MQRPASRTWFLFLGRRWIVLLACAFSLSAAVAKACPLCEAIPGTFSDDLDDSAASVIACVEGTSEESLGFSIYRLQILHVLKGDSRLRNTVVELPSMRRLSRQDVCLLVARGDTDIEWDPPKLVSLETVSYVSGLNRLSKNGLDRLLYFLKFIKHSEDVISADAQNELASASLADLARCSESLDREWLIAQLRDVSTPLQRRRLCWMLLSQCGKEADSRLFDELIAIQQDDESFHIALDAAIACYVAIGGQQALDRIERDFLANADASYADASAAVRALRVHGTDLRVFSRERLAGALRHLLSKPDRADLVIADLARWEDWSAVDQMVELFKSSSQNHGFVKLSIVRYLKACPLPVGRETLEMIRSTDARSVRFAETSMILSPNRPLASGLAASPREESADSATSVTADTGEALHSASR